MPYITLYKSEVNIPSLFITVSMKHFSDNHGDSGQKLIWACKHKKNNG